MLKQYYYESLTSAEKNVYEKILSALLNTERECVFSIANLTEDGVIKALTAVAYDHPEIVEYFSKLFDYVSDGNNMRIKLDYTTIDRAAYQDGLDKMIDEIELNLPLNASDYLVCKTIFDTIASKVKYDDDAANKFCEIEQLGKDNSRDYESRKIEFITKESEPFSPYGIVVNEKGVCEGIAKLYKILCDKFGIECACVEATIKEDGIPHMLNVVEVSGQRAFVDVTNGLKGIITGLPVIVYDYFLTSSRLYSKLCDIKEDFNCNYETINFYTKNDVWFESLYDLRCYLCSYTIASTNGEVRFYYNGEYASDQELTKLVEDILTEHCENGYYVRGRYVNNGFCTALVTKKDNKSDRKD